MLEGGTMVSARPSGTEPKIKFYINATAPEAKEAEELCAKIKAELQAVLDSAK